MNYIGSKKSLLPFLQKAIQEIAGEEKMTFLDLFAGTGAVGQHFKQLGYRIIANDLQYYSFVLNKNYIGNHKILLFLGLETDIPTLKTQPNQFRAAGVCQYLDSLVLRNQAEKGFIFQNYALGGTKGQEFERQYFSDTNALKADTIRKKIEIWKKNSLINENEYFFLLATLLENLDKVANTASVYGAFLKKLKKSAQQTFVMQPAHFSLSEQPHEVFNEPIEELLPRISGDILYLDPPYNQRQYAPNYHILETLAKYDNPIITGKTGMRNYSEQKSQFASQKTAAKALEKVVSDAKVRYIFLSYNNEGLMPLEQIQEIMGKRGKYGCFTKKYGRFKADRTENRNHKADSVVEYLHYVVCE